MKERTKRLYKNKKLKRTIKYVAIAIFIAIAIAFLTVTLVFVYRTSINPSAAFEVNASSEIESDSEISEEDDTSAENELDFSDKTVNILVLGMDSDEERLESDREDFRTDTMLLVSIDFEEETVNMITVPRDSYVTVTNASGSLYKVNSAAYFGGGMCDSGFLNACDTISGVFGGIPVDYYVAVNMDRISGSGGTRLGVSTMTLMMMWLL